MGDDEEEYVELSIKKVPKSFRVSQVVQVVDVDEEEYPDEEDDYYDDEEDGHVEEEPFSVPPPSPFGAGLKKTPPPRQAPQPGLPSYQPKSSFPPQQQHHQPAHQPQSFTKPLPQPSSALPKGPVRPAHPAPTPGGSPSVGGGAGAGAGAGGSPGLAVPQRPLPKGPPGKPLPQAPGRALPSAPAPTPGGRKLPMPAPKAAPPTPGHGNLSQSAGAPTHTSHSNVSGKLMFDLF